MFITIPKPTNRYRPQPGGPARTDAVIESKTREFYQELLTGFEQLANDYRIAVAVATMRVQGGRDPQVGETTLERSWFNEDLLV